MSDEQRHENIPVPDPSRLTTEQYNRGMETQRRELLSLRELLVSEMNRIERVHEEKFKSIETRFAEGKTALDAALRAAQNLVDAQNRSNAEASEKSERSFTKQIEALDAQTRTITSSQSREISEMKEQFVRSEGATKGGADNTARLMSAAMFLIALATAFYAISSSHSTVPTPTIVSPAVIPVQPK